MKKQDSTISSLRAFCKNAWQSIIMHTLRILLCHCERDLSRVAIQMKESRFNDSIAKFTFCKIMDCFGLRNDAVIESQEIQIMDCHENFSNFLAITGRQIASHLTMTWGNPNDKIRESQEQGGIAGASL